MAEDTDTKDDTPIIIKKIVKGGGHHGGAWKVAYADFVTAMMAFFLLLWLLNVSTDEELRALAGEFQPDNMTISSELSGAGGLFGGNSMSVDGAMNSQVQPLARGNNSGLGRSHGHPGLDNLVGLHCGERRKLS